MNTKTNSYDNIPTFAQDATKSMYAQLDYIVSMFETEKHEKNIAYSFILENGLLDLFKVYYANHQDDRFDRDTMQSLVSRAVANSVANVG